MFFQALEWFKGIWTKIRLEFFVPRYTIEFGAGGYWCAYPEHKSIRLISRTEGPSIDFEVRKFKIFLIRCRSVLELKTKTKVYSEKNYTFTIESNSENYIIFEILSENEFIGREIVCFHVKIENNKFCDMLDKLNLMTDIAVDTITEIELQKL